MFEQLIKGLLLGLSLGTTCIVTCGPVFLPVLLRDKRKALEGFGKTGMFLLGRLAGYLSFGAVAALFGMNVPQTYRSLIVDISYILISALLLYNAIRPPLKEICAAHGVRRHFQNPILLGLLTGINLCPPFALALGGAFDSGGVFAGVLMFGGFFLGTSLWMIPMAFFAGMSHYKGVRISARVLAGLVAIYFIAMGISGLVLDIPQLAADKQNSQVSVTEDALGDSLEIVNFIETDSIYIYSPDSTFLERTHSIYDSLSSCQIAIPVHDISTLSENELLISLFPDTLEIDSTHISSIINLNISSVSANISIINPSKDIEKLVSFLREYYFKDRISRGFHFYFAGTFCHGNAHNHDGEND